MSKHSTMSRRFGNSDCVTWISMVFFHIEYSEGWYQETNFIFGGHVLNIHVHDLQENERDDKIEHETNTLRLHAVNAFLTLECSTSRSPYVSLKFRHLSFFIWHLLHVYLFMWPQHRPTCYSTYQHRVTNCTNISTIIYEQNKKARLNELHKVS